MSARSHSCPSCDRPMRQVERRGVLVDACRDCGLAFLDRAEMDRLFGSDGPDLAVEGIGEDRCTAHRDDDNDHGSSNRATGGGRRRNKGRPVGEILDRG